jgi:hypothetical protein
MLPATLTQSKSLLTLLKYGIFVLIAGVSYLIIKRIYNRARQVNELNKFNTSTSAGRSVQYATLFYNAIIRTNEWMNDWFGDGTDLKTIYETAATIYQDREVNFQDVARSYRNLYNRDLLIDLQKDLSSSEYAKFNEILKQGIPGLGDLPIIVTRRDAIILGEDLNPVNNARANTKLGRHVESLLLSGDRLVHGFSYNGMMRYVSADVAELVR